MQINEISVSDLKVMFDQKEDFQLVDVREIHESQAASIGGDLIPMGLVPVQIDRISREKKVVVYCRSGGRSSNVIAFLQNNHGYTNLYNLHGGITAYAREIDQSLQVI